MTDRMQSKYEAVRQYLKASLESMIAAGRNIREFTEFTLEKFGDHFYPYLHEFYEDVRKERITIKGLTRNARITIFGHHISHDEREEMIRKAAYYQAEKRGFQDGSQEQDWQEAEKLVDEQLEKEAGLVDKSHKVMTSATSIVEKEVDNIKSVVKNWLKRQEKGGHKGMKDKDKNTNKHKTRSRKK